MKVLGLQGVTDGNPVRTAISDRAPPCLLDYVNRQFRMPRPNALWVSDITYVATWMGFVYTAAGPTGNIPLAEAEDRY